MAIESPGTIGSPSIGDRDADKGMIHRARYSRAQRRVNRVGGITTEANSHGSDAAVNQKRVSDPRLV